VWGGPDGFGNVTPCFCGSHFPFILDGGWNSLKGLNVGVGGLRRGTPAAGQERGKANVWGEGRKENRDI